MGGHASPRPYDFPATVSRVWGPGRAAGLYPGRGVPGLWTMGLGVPVGADDPGHAQGRIHDHARRLPPPKPQRKHVLVGAPSLVGDPDAPYGRARVLQRPSEVGEPELGFGFDEKSAVYRAQPLEDDVLHWLQGEEGDHG